ncbi:3-deoxy-D-manno-octulosonic acid transferase [Advenella mimigardefordensis]|uniref:3-deoxy-D-manno-octulosonic acid transferase n=1 Tax=Advenella mimigardefordensis (strain DSM 17166 / LMG 22922 / DPN7) TaxID=1247726 RepID=W0PBC1_ADVMD|nr:3-deoxy-D-manno-octulosonic acid transferase [Advenella mimigardefordensis]AHG62772.1 3-deoxy-D-manno-octulosonic-acid transferase [Advenella mimigardefordensis DPN7]
MNRYFYTAILRMASPVLLWWLQRRARKAGGVWDIRGPERYGRYTERPQASPQDEDDGYAESVFDFARPVWVHAVSLGETRAAQPLVQALLDQGLPVLLTHFTETGRSIGGKLFAPAINTGRLCQAWMPYDFPEAVQGFLDYWKPRCCILIEREIWPNMVAQAKKQNIPVIVASARFSPASLRRGQLLGSVLRKALTSIDLILTQTHIDAARLAEIGVKRTRVVGNLKFDLRISPEQSHMGQVARRHIGRPVIVIASTREGEDELFTRAIAQIKKTYQSEQAPRNDAQRQDPSEAGQNPMPLFVLVPRHPQRFDQVAGYLADDGLSVCRRSAYPTDKQLRTTDVLLGDSVGEMFFFYGLADVAIVAGSFAELGGQNHIEASALGLPVIVGPHTRNFQQSVEDALAEGAARRAHTPSEAVDLALRILENPELRLGMSRAAKEWLSLHEGATDRIMTALQPYLK